MQGTNINDDKNEDFTLISIDQSWLAYKLQMKIQLVTCPVCYSIPLDYAIQCEKCQRIFCRKDYKNICEIDDKCPTCKITPWNKKKQLHIAYRNMFDSLKFKCKQCNMQNTQYNSNQLITHLSTHKIYLSQESIILDYTIISINDGIEANLTLTQNLQMNSKRIMGQNNFEIAGSAGRIVNVNLKDMQMQHPTRGKCRIIKHQSTMIKRNQQYNIWGVNIGDVDDIWNSHERFVFYSEQLQGQIQKNYQDYLKNQRFNQFCIDVRDSRFRISFKNMMQINTFTSSQKSMARVPILFR